MHAIFKRVHSSCVMENIRGMHPYMRFQNEHVITAFSDSKYDIIQSHFFCNDAHIASIETRFVISCVIKLKAFR